MSAGIGVAAIYSVPAPFSPVMGEDDIDPFKEVEEDEEQQSAVCWRR